MPGDRQQVRAAELDLRTLRPPSEATPQTPLSLTADDGEILADEAARALSAGKPRVSKKRRPVHTHGSFARGTFTAGTRAAGWTYARHLQQSVTTPVVARFSNSLPSAQRKDHARSARGLAVRFEVSGGPPTDMVAMNTKSFFVSDREEFGALSRALGSHWLLRLPRLVLLIMFRHLRFGLAVRMATLWPPSSYARCVYHGINTFIWSVQANDLPRQHAVRFRWEPVLPESHLLPWRYFHRDGATFLERDLRERLRSTEPDGMVSFLLRVQLRENAPDKSLTDATRTWKGEWTTVGKLDLDTFVEDAAEVAQLDAVSFSPLHLCPGIEAHPDDKILALRAAAYPAAHFRRTEASR